MKAYKGKILKTTEKYTIVLSDDGNFHSIETRGDMEVAKEVLYTDMDMVKIGGKNMSVKRPFSQMALVASFFLVIIIGSFGFLSTEDAYAVVSMDINPSIEMYLDDELNIMKTKGFNEEGKEVLAGVKRGMNVNAAAKEIVVAAEAKGYLNDTKNGVLVSTALTQEKAKDENKNSEEKKTGEKEAEKINQDIYKAIAEVSLESTVVFTAEAGNAEIKAAHKAGISLGRYALQIDAEGQIQLNGKESITEVIQMLKEKNLLKLIDINIQEKEQTPKDSDSSSGEIKDETLNTVKDVKDETLNTVKDVKDETLNTVKDIKDETLNTVKDVKDETLNTVKDIKDETLNTVKDVKDETLNTVKDVKDETLNTIKDVKEETLKTFKDAIPQN